MKAFLFMGSIFSAFMIFVGFVAKKTMREMLSEMRRSLREVFFAMFVAAIWIISKIKEKREGS